MEAKDTVMTKKQKIELARDCWKTKHTYPELMARKQAEVTWPLAFGEGEKVGIRGVVEWVEEHTIVDDWAGWHEQKEEWGIES